MPVVVADVATGPDGPHVRAMLVTMLAFVPCPASVRYLCSTVLWPRTKTWASA